jgi:hypothetical protein
MPTFRATPRIRYAIPEPPDPGEWRACRDYLYGIDLSAQCSAPPRPQTQYVGST